MPNHAVVERQETSSFRRHAIKAARDLYYSEEVIEKLKAATTIDEMSRIMRATRREKFA